MVDQPDQEQRKPDPHETMLLAFGAKREEYSTTIKNAAAAFKNTTDLRQAEHLLYDVRQKLVDYKVQLSVALSQMNKQLRKMKSDRLMKHKRNEINIAFANPTERKVYDDAYFASVNDVIDQFDAQLSWVKDSMAGCDEMSNGMSYYIKLSNLLGGRTD